MKGRLALLAMMLCGFALLELRCFPRVTPRAPLPGLVSSLLPPAVGDFHRGRSWRSQVGRGVEVGARYEEAGRAVTLDYLLNAWTGHNNVGCWLVAGYPMISERLRTMPTAAGNATFDVAFFRQKRHLVLVASTECGTAGCEEHTLSPHPGFGVGLSLPSLAAADLAPIPVAILIRARRDSTHGQAAQLQRLTSTFARFAAALDLQAAQSTPSDPQLAKAGYRG